MISIGGSDRHFKIKKKKTDVETLPKEEVINCSCASNQEDGLMIQVCLDHFCFKCIIQLFKTFFILLLILFSINSYRSFNLNFCIQLPNYIFDI